MEFDDQEEQDEEMGMPEPPHPPPPPSYDSVGNSARSKIGAAEGRKGAFGAAAVRYRECQKNHAVSFGGHAVDGCCEFMAAGEDGTLEAVICAACNCHRNFHRKEMDGEMSSFHHRQPPPPPLHHHHQFSPYYHHRIPQHPPGAGYLHHPLATPPMAQHRPLALPAAASGGGLSRDEEDMSNPSSSGGGGGGGGGSKKRFRTKFTQEQKDKMLAFAEQLGWRIQKHDESAVEQFCAETNVKRNVLKVWMHNNKNTLGKKP
ncbi:zinc-finger homeodomain protein 2 [Cajanus cajan]|uniref:ZF-HD homeobox protein At4g24660 family n=1 Tax=Cajanus cajan TaxID=3821 RepID=A0A151U090_CAJCA|nr:zinc-finger homeodomain protein 2 [Cajanus cajan]KYP72654.1 ZF-HD homeobox protein At4g24660 family [Cajanus cajan]